MQIKAEALKENLAKRLLLNPREAANALAISQRKLWSLTASGEIPSVKIGRCVRYRVAALEEYLAAQEKGGDAQQ